MRSVLVDVPAEARSIINRSSHIILRYVESDAISNILLPPKLYPVFHDAYDPGDENESASSESSEDDDSFSVDSYYSMHESDPSIDSDGHNAQAGTSSVPKKILIKGMAGIGKSTLAATVVCRQDVREAFDCICWVNVGKRMHETYPLNINDSGTEEDGKKMRNNLDYDMYRDCLRSIYNQVMAKNDSSSSSIAETENKKYDRIRQRFAEEVVCSSGDPLMQIAAKQVQAMLTARSEMAQILTGITSNMLIVLDDVWCNEDIDLFNFCCSGFTGPGLLSMLVTTRKSDEAQLPETYTMSLGLLNELDGAKLLGWELGLMEHFDFDALQLSDKILFLEISKKCEYLPLAIKMLGRSMKSFFNSSSGYSLDCVLKHAMMGWDVTDFRANNEAEASLENVSMFVALDRTFFLVVSNIESSNFLKLCFGALAVAFTRVECRRPWISLDIVLLLWKALLESQDEGIVLTLRKDGICRSSDVCKILETVGAIDILYNPNDHNIKRKYARVGHDLLMEFGKQYLEINLPIKFTVYEDRNLLLQWLKPKSAAKVIDRPTAISQFLNKEVVTIYDELTNGFYNSHSDDGHLFIYYPLHIINGDLLTKAFHLLNNQNFISTRLQVIGMEEGIHRHMQDMELLFKKSCYGKLPGMQKDTKELIVELVNCVVSSIVSSDQLSTNSESMEMHAVKMKIYLKARGLVIVGAGIQKFNLWNISMDCFSKALQYLRLAKLPNTHPDVLRVMRYIDTATLYPLQLVSKDSHKRIILKHAASLREGNVTSGLPLVLSSHPGRAIVPVKNHFDSSSFSGQYIFLGIGAEESAMKVSYDGDFIARVDDGAVMNVLQGWINEGVTITIKPGPTSKRERLRQLQMTNASRRFIINEDGTVSAASRPNLVLGLSFYPKLYLVDQFSPNRAVFKNVNALSDDNEDGDILLELISHPEHAIAPTSEEIVSLKFFIFVKLGLGPKENALKVFRCKNKIFFRGCNDLYLAWNYSGSVAGTPINLLGSDIPHSSQTFFQKIFIKFVIDKWSNFCINNDGTISPLNAPHLALGFQVPNFCNPPHEPVSGHTHDALNEKPVMSLRNLFIIATMKSFLMEKIKQSQ